MPEPVDLNFVTTDVWGGSVLQWATKFTDVKHLVDQAIAKLKPGQCIRRLVITGHGADHTDGFFVFDPDTSGAQLIDGGTKRQPISPSVVKEFQRLKAHFCKDAIIEFRVCRFGSGTNGQKAMQAVADAAGVPVTAPMGSISSLAAIGGLATDWRVAYPKSWGLSTRASFWRGGPTLPPQGAPSPGGHRADHRPGRAAARDFQPTATNRAAASPKGVHREPTARHIAHGAGRGRSGSACRGARLRVGRGQFLAAGHGGANP